ncbi:hypothetical protein BH09ACT6_BH09ACT6_05960 [soil metagenome]
MTPDYSPKTGRAARSTDAESVSRREAVDRWQRKFTDQVVDNVIFFRDARRLTNEELRRRLSMLGWDLTKDSLASILAGSAKRKTMPVTDVLLFAQALNVSPTALIFPTHTNADVSLAPIATDAEEAPTAYQAARWFSGENGSLTLPVRFEGDSLADFYDVAEILKTFESHEDFVQQFDLINAALVAGIDDTEDQRLATEQLGKRVIWTLASDRSILRRTAPGFQLPELRPPLRFVDEPNYTIPMLPLPSYSTREEIEQAKQLNEKKPAE